MKLHLTSVTLCVLAIAPMCVSAANPIAAADTLPHPEEGYNYLYNEDNADWVARHLENIELPKIDAATYNLSAKQAKKLEERLDSALYGDAGFVTRTYIRQHPDSWTSLWLINAIEYWLRTGEGPGIDNENAMILTDIILNKYYDANVAKNFARPTDYNTFRELYLDMMERFIQDDDNAPNYGQALYSFQNTNFDRYSAWKANRVAKSAAIPGFDADKEEALYNAIYNDAKDYLNLTYSGGTGDWIRYVGCDMAFLCDLTFIFSDMLPGQPENIEYLNPASAQAPTVNEVKQMLQPFVDRYDEEYTSPYDQDFSSDKFNKELKVVKQRMADDIVKWYEMRLATQASLPADKQGIYGLITNDRLEALKLYTDILADDCGWGFAGLFQNGE